MGDRELSVKAAAEQAGVSERHMRRLVRAGTIRARQVSGWFWLVDAADLGRWVKDRDRDQDARRQ